VPSPRQRDLAPRALLSFAKAPRASGGSSTVAGCGKSRKTSAQKRAIKDAAFQWDDPLTRGKLDRDERMVRGHRARLCAEKLFPRVLRRTAMRSSIRRWRAKWASWAFLGSTIPEEYGGAGLNYVCYGLIARELERVDSGFRSAMSVQSSLAMQAIYAYATRPAAQIPAENGDRRTARLLRTHRGPTTARSRLHVTRAEKVAGGFRLTGNRPGSPTRRSRTWPWSGRSSKARSAALCRTRHQGIFDAEDRRQTLAARLDHRRDRARWRRVPEEKSAAERFRACRPFGCLNVARAGIAWGAIGAAEFCWHRAREYALTRKQFGRPLAANQLVQKKLADMQTEITLGLHAALRMSRLIDQGKASPPAIHCSSATIAARRSTSPAWRATCTAATASPRIHVMRVLCNLETVNTYEGHARHPRADSRRAQTGIQAFM